MLKNLVTNRLWKIGVRYHHGKVLIYTLKGNPGKFDTPSWAVDIREILIIVLAGICCILFIMEDQYEMAKDILTLLAGYVLGRTIPGGAVKTLKTTPT